MTRESLDTLKSSVKLYFLALVLCAVIAGIGFYGMYRLRVMNENLKSLYKDRLVPIKQLTAIRYDYGYGIYSTLKQLQDKSISIADAKGRINASQKKIEHNWYAYKMTYLTTEEKRLVQEAEILKRNADNHINKIEEDLNKEITLHVNEDYIAKIPLLISKLNELVELQLAVSEQINTENEKIYTSTFKEFFIVITTSLVFTLLLSFYIVRDTNLLIKRLKFTTYKMLESEEKSRAYIEYAGDGIIMFGDDLELINFNSSIVNMLGYKRFELRNLKFSDLFFEDDLKLNPLKLKLVQKQNGLLSERNLKKKDNTFIETEINTKPLFGGGYVAVIRDITERKRAERELIQNNIHLKKTNSELDRFVYHTSHDLRAPLTSLLGLIRITEMELLPEQIEIKNNISMMIRMVNRLDDFIGDILAYSKNSRLEVIENEIIFENMITEVKENLLYMEGADKIKMNVNIKQNGTFVSDKMRLEVILGNFISNAIKYQDKTKEYRFINLSIHSNSEKVTIEVEDNGIGIAEEYKGRIFEIFYRASTISSGSGLGLYIVKEVISKLNGHLDMESELHKGTKFTVVIPNMFKT